MEILLSIFETPESQIKGKQYKFSNCLPLISSTKQQNPAVVNFDRHGESHSSSIGSPTRDDESELVDGKLSYRLQ